jgi:phage gp36-like protein
VAYSSQTDIERRLPLRFLQQLTDDANGLIVDTDVIADAIADADSTIDSFCRGKHDLPFSPVPDSVKRWSAWLAIYNLYNRRVDLQVPVQVKGKYDLIVTELKAVRDQKIYINDTTSDANTANFYKIKTKQSQPIFQTNSSKTGRLDRFFGPVDGLDNS